MCLELNPGPCAHRQVLLPSCTTPTGLGYLKVVGDIAESITVGEEGRVALLFSDIKDPEMFRHAKQDSCF